MLVKILKYLLCTRYQKRKIGIALHFICKRQNFSRISATFCEVFLCFSLVRNTRKIFSTNVPATAITSINGIRVFSILWVILGHTFLTAGLSPFVGKYDRLYCDVYFEKIYLLFEPKFF
jgi:hypothetical protein